MRFAALGLLPVLAASLAATPAPACTNTHALRQLEIRSTPGSNGGRPVQVDLVFVGQREALQLVGRLTARDYFAAREQLRREFGPNLTIQSWQLPAGRFVENTRIAPPCRLAGALLFVDYDNGGANRLVLGAARAGVLLLGDEGFAWQAR